MEARRVTAPQRRAGAADRLGTPHVSRLSTTRSLRSEKVERHFPPFPAPA